MIINVLAEDTADSITFIREHGLCLYIQTKDHKILFDTGASAIFAQNACKMTVDLSEVDLVVISHGHYDHGGGLNTFLSINSKAKVYCHQRAFEEHYSERPNGVKEYIGLDDTILTKERFVFCGDRLVIDEELELFSGVKGEKLLPPGNSNLLLKVGEAYLRDDFSHEQNLIINENGKTLLIVGCAHKGIVNIIEHFRSERGCLPDWIIGGFHLNYNGNNECDDSNLVNKIGEFLLNTNTQCYNCHCTGTEAYSRLKAIMGEKIEYLSTGNQLTI
ncbi:MAG: MBL fold metallo-hydrolase [Oscillospiraceae bacterium]|nr:MBL fold metallo-hydrolase [Oscillospiraceae bacterium]